MTESETTSATSKLDNKTVLLGPVAAWCMLLFSILGAVASAELLWSEIELVGDPEATLVCDVNLLIGCSDSLLSWQAHLLTLPNSLFGLVAFSALATLAVLQVSKIALPKWIWAALMAGALAGLGLVVFFLVQALTNFRTVCPFCALVWAATLALFWLIWLGGLQHSRKPVLAEIGQSLLKFSWALILSSYLLVILMVALALPTELAASF